MTPFRFTRTFSGLSLAIVLVCGCSQGTSTAESNPPSKESTSMSDPISQVQAYIKEQSIDTAKDNWRIRLPKFPSVTYEDGKAYFWDLKTSEGDIRIKLLQDDAPEHVANFLYLTELGFFDGLSFHRVITQFMAQGGCPIGTGTGSPGYRFAGEFDSNQRHNRPGLLSMANAGPGTDGSQFFITFVETPWLDGNHTIFGEVTEGMDTVKALEAAGSRSGRPSKALSIEKATITVE